ncbi:hypothetical protein D9758_006589 [Tetrapyrgos nigripes]|uniref:F-box domain-containing protein n=1 Tax=Tetrapyrgos nigripes TaxID=182062 RepID=A0A8H5LQ77_9AGAR|nr:hypothetical protein D9758_006589 [Tetrapyrgos nigripes]
MACPNCGGIKPYASRCDPENVSARINSMLRTIPFSSSSALRIRRDVEDDIRGFDWEISQLRSRLLYLEELQELLSKHDEQLKSLSAPIRRLPVELLTRIFVAVCDGHPITFAAHARMERFGCLPFTLASVCSGWRQIVIDIPRLWSNLKLLWAHSASFTHSHLEQSLRLCLVRSKSYALSIGDLLEAKFPSLTSGKSFPLLETLEVRHYRAGDGLPDLFLFNSAPRLHSLKTSQLPPPERLRAFTPRNQITNLEVIYGWSVYAELHNFPNLKSLVYAEVDHEFVPGPEEPPWQTLPHLSMVEFQMSTCEAGHEEISQNHLLKLLIDKLTLPSLTTLAIKNLHKRVDDDSVERMFKGNWPHQAFADFFQRSACSLSALHLDHISLPDTDLCSLLKLHPCLIELRVREIRRKDYDFAPYPLDDGTVFQFQDLITPLLLTTLHAFNHGLTSSSPLVPKLQNLYFAADGDLFDDVLFWKMVVSRWVPNSDTSSCRENASASATRVTCLRSVKLRVLGRALREDVDLKLRHLKKAGLDFALLSEGKEDTEI